MHAERILRDILPDARDLPWQQAAPDAEADDQLVGLHEALRIEDRDAMRVDQERMEVGDVGDRIVLELERVDRAHRIGVVGRARRCQARREGEQRGSEEQWAEVHGRSGLGR